MKIIGPRKRGVVVLELQGKYNTAKVFTDNVEAEAISQIVTLLNQKFASGSQIRIMPDTHAGAGCTIGTTMTISDKVVPNMVGVDIGCGMETVLLKDTQVDLAALDGVIHRDVPAGFNIRKKPHPLLKQTKLEELRCKKVINLSRAELSLGTLGGGNHFIELNRDDDGQIYLVVHTGSRNLGKQVAEYYQREAVRHQTSGYMETEAMGRMIQSMKKQGRKKEIQRALKDARPKMLGHADKSLAYVEGASLEDYLHDMNIVQHYASLNRQAIVQSIVEGMGFTVKDQFSTIHNYIDLSSMILRKGAISAKEGERVLIPINMRDGSLLCVGKGNPDWNWSAPHGAGRLMSRSAAKASIALEDYENAMKGIYSTTVCRSTLDEAPFAYKPIEEIIENIQETVSIEAIIHPLYNFKATQ